MSYFTKTYLAGSFCLFLAELALVLFFSHITQDCKAKQTKSVSSPPRLHQSVSTCTSSYQTMGRSFATYTPADVTQDCNRVTERQFQPFGTSSSSSALRANSLDSVVGNTRDVETEFKGPCPLGAICRAISTVFCFFFSTVPNEETAYAPACGRLQEDALHPASFVTELVSLWAQTPQAVRDVLG